MNICDLFRDDDAVSSVLGVVLMVAVTIVLAAVIGTFVLGIGEELTDPSPRVVFEYSMDVDDGPGNSSVVVLHSNGDQFDRQNVEITIDGDLAYVNGRTQGQYSAGGGGWPVRVTAGDRLEIEDSGSQIESGDMLRIIWNDGEHASIIGEQRID